ncbi:MerR family transcriptional regulator [Actinomyces culturomici]|uniref:hypothetical protein n=1 Tax=Actinomyces culturomici TaxID=1926276 RepID=UPI000E20BF4F|nr:hypothetical protein [Actinomyces culturomici]
MSEVHGVESRACPVSGEVLGSGEFVSRSAVNRVVTAVSDLPELLGDLEYAAAGLRRGESSAGGVPSSKEPVNLGLVVEVWDLSEVLWEWAQALLVFVMGPRYSVPRGDWRGVRRVFTEYRDRIGGWAEAPELVEAVLFAVRRLERLASPDARRLMFAGRCPSCGLEVLASPDASEVSCACGVVVDVAEARGRLLEEAGRRALPRPRAREVAELIALRVIPDATVRQWCSRGRLQPVAFSSGRRLYRPADIAALATARCGV